MWAVFLSLLRWLHLVKPEPLTEADWPETAGPPQEDAPLPRADEVVKAGWGQAGVQAPTGRPAPWVSGWYTGAKKAPAHVGRVGGSIVPKAVVVHTTDMHPSSHDALVRAWTQRKGGGNCAHFLIGRSEEQGVHQFCPITRNGNHAGGRNGHGWYRLPTGQLLHPNSVTVGIELDCAGRLKWDGRRWTHPDSGKEIPDGEVAVIGGKGWHAVTPYQLWALKALLDDLYPCLLELPVGTKIAANGNHAEESVPWARMDGIRVVGHATLDPRRKNDPGPQVTAWLKEQT